MAHTAAIYLYTAAHLINYVQSCSEPFKQEDIPLDFDDAHETTSKVQLSQKQAEWMRERVGASV